MNLDQTLLVYFLQAGAVVKTVMGLLLIASLVSWTLIFQRSQYVRQGKRVFADFENQFWSGVDLAKLYHQFKIQRIEPDGIGGIFFAGYREFLRLRQQATVDQEIAFQSMMRAMRVATTKYIARLEANLPLLATIGSVSPYVGLFGTVWGIMTSFHALGSVQQASIAMVAPGISEALIATAMGLFAAIPAVVAYNRFTAEIDRLLTQYETFQEEFATLMQRQLITNAVVDEV
ncbi:MAG: protein TolQ [Gammaproteobacteria bacterium]|nr:protein TolQ [Gammaproteobacteria bacterium]